MEEAKQKDVGQGERKGHQRTLDEELEPGHGGQVLPPHIHGDGVGAYRKEGEEEGECDAPHDFRNGLRSPGDFPEG